MSNNRKERHHTVPQVYLRSFADTSSQVIVANLTTKQAYHNNIINVSVADKFYNVYLKDTSGKYISPTYYEDLLSEIEGIVSPVIKKVTQEMIWPLSYSERLILSKFISTQFVRGHDKRDIRDSYNSYIAKAQYALEGRDIFLANASSLTEKKKLEEEWKRMEEGSLDIKHSSTDHTLTFLKEIDSYITAIDNRIWHLYHFDNLELLTCDNPVVIVRNVTREVHLTPDTVTGIEDSPYLYYPISRKMGILMIHPLLMDYDDDFEDKAFSQKEMSNGNDSWATFNNCIIANAHKEIYCHPDGTAMLPNPLPAPANLKINGPTFAEWIEIGKLLGRNL